MRIGQSHHTIHLYLNLRNSHTLQWQIDEYKRNFIIARFLNRWQTKRKIPPYVYTRPLTTKELKLDLQYLSHVLRAFVESRAERYEFRPSQLGCEAFLREWRGQRRKTEKLGKERREKGAGQKGGRVISYYEWSNPVQVRHHCRCEQVEDALGLAYHAWHSHQKIYPSARTRR